MSSINRRIVLAQHPDGLPKLSDFRLEEAPKPVAAPGQVLLKTVYMSLDPYMRTRMNAFPSYAPPIPLGGVMVAGTVSKIVESRHDSFKVGDLVLSEAGWQDFALSDGSDLLRLPSDMKHPSYALGVLGMPGFTAWHGLLKIGRPKKGETAVISTASGAVGSTAGQIAKIHGCRVVGIAGSDEKCRHAVEALGFDVCLNYRADDFATQLAASCPDGIDIYYENVGGTIFTTVFPLLNVHARIPVCGVISQYNNDPIPCTEENSIAPFMTKVLNKRLTFEGFIIGDHHEQEYAPFVQEMTQWVESGKIRFFEHHAKGLENAPSVFIDFLQGKYRGKLIVDV